VAVFDKLLIANRGEIACRIASTAKRMGIPTVAIFSEADAEARHVRLADEAIFIGAAPAAESYLSVERILRACRATGAKAVHPGYGFLSENAGFARAVEEAGLVFVGPAPDTIATMGDKLAARALAERAGLAVVPGSGVLTSVDEARAAANTIGYPVMLKACAGGGGRGLRLVRSGAEMETAFDACRREAAGAFGDDRLYLECRLERVRHVEVQVLADAHGHVIHLGERDCSIQRRHQKLVEEAPSPFLDPGMRAAIAGQAVALAREAGYRSAGTVEFLIDEAHNAYFLEVNPRLQVEHTVTEMTTGIDLVEWMFRIAAGEALPWAQADIATKGHAIECRITAEIAERGFLPSLGRISRLQLPQETAGGVRVDSGVEEGDRVGPHYDSLLAKVIVAGATRAEAIERMRLALDGLAVRGVSSNACFLAGLMRHPTFVAGGHSAGFVDDAFPSGYRSGPPTAEDLTDFAVVAAVAYRRRHECATRVVGVPPGPNYRLEDELVVRLAGEERTLRVREMRGAHRVTSADETADVVAEWRFAQPVVRGTLRGRPFAMRVERRGHAWRLGRGGFETEVIVLPRRAAALWPYLPTSAVSEAIDRIASPMAGTLVALSVAVGQEVRAGDAVATVEAMKMESAVFAERDGRVAQVLVRCGDFLAADQTIVTLE
jgi:propionyl-CoA carboxylase alpha chain